MGRVSEGDLLGSRDEVAGRDLMGGRLPLATMVEGAVDVNAYDPYDPKECFQVMVEPMVYFGACV